MASITEEPGPPKSPSQTAPKPRTRPPSTPTTTRSTINNTQNPFHFWFYFTLIVSLITLVFISLSYLAPEDPKIWFLTLPINLRNHYPKGRTIKVQTSPNQPQVKIFTIQEGPIKCDHVLIVHGVGCSSFAFSRIVKSLGQKGVHAVSIDLPGSGFSDKSLVVVGEKSGGVLGRFWEICSDIQEKGLFWGFDQLVEQGYVNYDENEVKVSKRESVKAIELGPEEMGRVLGQVIDSMGLPPVDLVLHDSALGLAANWISENPGLVRSIILLDSTSKGGAFPLWVLEIPVVSEVVLGFKLVFGKVLEFCCSRSMSMEDVEAHRTLLKGRNGREAIVGMGKKLNESFDLEEWSGLEGIKNLPMQVIWSNASSKEWSQEGHRVANALPLAKFATHSGGRWPQEHNSVEVAESIYQFISSLPKPARQMEEDSIPEHIQRMFDEAKSSDHHHHFDNHDGNDHDDGHAHINPAGYMNAYGLGYGWAS